MAASLVSARSFKEIENHLVCDVCTKTINEPKKLPCSHSFCKACLENLATQAKDNADGEGKTLHCPTCRSKTTLKPDENVAGLPDDKSVLKLLTAVGPNRDQEASVCSMCEKKPSFAICIECSGKELLCDSCVVDHDRWPTNEPHTILSISDVVNRDQHKECGAEQLSCTLHKDTIPSFYCETCKELICMRKCATSHHKKPGHTFVAVHEIYYDLLLQALSNILLSSEDSSSPPRPSNFGEAWAELKENTKINITHVIFFLFKSKKHDLYKSTMLQATMYPKCNDLNDYRLTEQCDLSMQDIVRLSREARQN